MIRISPLVWVSGGLVSLTLSVILAGDSLVGLVPSREQQTFDYRRDLAESLAVQYSVLAERNQVEVITQSMEALAARNKDIVSAALRLADGTVKAQVGNHTQAWVQPPGEQSTLESLQVPIFSGEQPWGVLQIAFQPAEAAGVWWFVTHPWIQFLAVVSVLGFAGYLYFMKRTLKQLDPSNIVPTRVKAALDALTQGVVMLDTRDCVVLANEAFTCRVNTPLAELLGTDLGRLPWRRAGDASVHPWTTAIMDQAAQTGAQIEIRLAEGAVKKFIVNVVPILDDGRVVRGALASFEDVTELERVNSSLMEAVKNLEASRQEIVERNVQLDISNRSLESEMQERKRAEAEREEMNQCLVAASRKAGMADVASTVLHNVGNVLNSVNVSVSVVTTTLRQSPIGDVGSIATMLQEQGADMGRFLTQDERGQQIPAYLAMLADSVKGNYEAVQKEMESLRQNVEHIKHIVMSQQDLAKPQVVEEPCELAELMEQAIRINQTSIEKMRVTVVREYAELPAIMTDRHQVLQILVNLVTNAHQAMVARPALNHCLTLRVGAPSAETHGYCRMEVQDTGSGIKAEHVSRMFTQGFTTKKEGHGLGLHGAILSAKAMGGTLTVHSEGEGHGATFRLDLPQRMVKVAA